jgi:hypothetical protein
MFHAKSTRNSLTDVSTTNFEQAGRTTRKMAHISSEYDSKQSNPGTKMLELSLDVPPYKP